VSDGWLGPATENLDVDFLDFSLSESKCRSSSRDPSCYCTHASLAALPGVMFKIIPPPVTNANNIYKKMLF
jgi:hypothetical protein